MLETLEQTKHHHKAEVAQVGYSQKTWSSSADGLCRFDMKHLWSNSLKLINFAKKLTNFVQGLQPTISDLTPLPPPHVILV
jgi:hypothetical protein